MNRFLGPASLGLSVLALAIALFGGRGEPAAPPPASEPASDVDTFASLELEALERRVESLEQSSLSLSKRLMLLEHRPVVASDGGVVAAVPASLAAEVEQLRSEVRGMIAGEALNSQGGRDYLKDAVRSVQEEMRTEQRELRQQQMIQAQAQAQAGRAERLRQFVSDAKLSYGQEQTLTQRMQTEDTQRQALFDSVRDGSKSFRDARQELRQLRQQTDKEMASVLDESQRAQYEQMRREERREDRPRGGGQRGRGQGGDQP
ncbi:hypothetical protein [Archangium violaceum]|uniref:Uncharacterized protein n=1 Tax=Archangium violaceum Cb vi76 TaxID=1406225 RepID=A0A084SMP1_9BACT|nr:hypothetical protein [Archangium violaceum]KFA89726.1 hypothetical protein Q664_33110 [Archangium violaceum Cb vi76]